MLYIQISNIDKFKMSYIHKFKVSRVTNIDKFKVSRVTITHIKQQGNQQSNIKNKMLEQPTI